MFTTIFFLVSFLSLFPGPSDCGYPDLVHMGSLISLKNMRYISEEKENGAGETQTTGISNVQKRQVFTQTGV